MSAGDTEILTVTPLGGGQEVGRSCILVEFKRRTLLLGKHDHSIQRVICDVMQSNEWL